jgi:hypothetical protein
MHKSSPRSQSSGFKPSAILEFEPVSFASARASADQLPQGLEAAVASTGEWGRLRQRSTRDDFALSTMALRWMTTLPKTLCPTQTAALYPRVINRIADAWYFADEREVVFGELLDSHRKNRRGFPVAVLHEVRALHAHAKTQPI